MDWKKLSEDAKVWGSKAKTAAEEAYKLSKEYAEQAKVQSYETLVSGSMTGLADLAAWEKVRDEKRLAVFCIRKDAPITTKMLLLFPIVFSKAWIESGTVKVMEHDASGELQEALNIPDAPTVLIYGNGICKKRVEDSEEILAFMKNFTFYVEEFPAGLGDLIDESVERTKNWELRTEN